MKSDPILRFVEGPLTSVSELQARTGPSLQGISVTTRRRSNTTGADTVSFAPWGRETNQVFPVMLFSLKCSWFTTLLVSGIQQSDSTIYIPFHYRLLQDSKHFPGLYSKSLLFIYFIYEWLSTNPKLLIYPSHLPLLYHKFMFYVWEAVSLLYIHSFVLFF